MGCVNAHIRALNEPFFCRVEIASKLEAPKIFLANRLKANIALQDVANIQVSDYAEHLNAIIANVCGLSISRIALLDSKGRFLFDCVKRKLYTKKE